VEKINHTPTTTVGIGTKPHISRKGGVWLIVVLLLLTALLGPVGQAGHSVYPLLADGDGPKIGAGG
jgi:hypothetical protein